MKHLILSICLLSGSIAVAQNYEFTQVAEIECTDIKSQDNTGTCWSYSTTSFVESELIRMGKENIDISEMYTVRMTYPKKAEAYIRYHGKNQFSQGSLAHDVIRAIDEHGLMTEAAYDGKNHGEKKHDHDEMERMLSAALDVALETKPISNKWPTAINAILDAYMGEVPEKFDYKGKSYSPTEFRDHLGFNADDYVSITSFTHHPFYEDFILEVPDNFSKGSFKNVKLDELIEVINYAIENGYSLSLDCDVSEETFSSKNGMAIWPAKPYNTLSIEEKENLFKEVIPEIMVTQEERQAAFDDQSTTDDHLMHITGILKDQNGTVYYQVKNSWGKRGKNGYIYMSEAYMRAKAISVLVHKDGIPKDLAKKIL